VAESLLDDLQVGAAGETGREHGRAGGRESGT
jgi:hypothetical protein